MHKTTNHRTPAAIVARLIVLIKPMLPIMAAAIVMGVAGHFCATFITIFGGFAILTAAGLQSPLPTVGTAFGCILVFALLRGVLRYAEQASNHYIAFRLLALIRDKVFGALRRLTPAKLEGRDRGDLISLITADIEALEVFYAHTISPVCIAVLWAAGMTAFTAHWNILPALALLAGYLLVGAALPVWSAKRGQVVAREYRQALADTNSYVLESLRGLRDTMQYQDTAARAAGITAHSETLGAKQTALKYREGLIVAVTNTLILFTTLAVLGVSLWLYQRGELAAQGVLVCTLTALSSFGPVVALANLGAGLTQVFASADRVLALLDEAPVTPEVTDGENTPFAGAEVRRQLWLRGGAGAAGDQPDHPGKKDRGHHRTLRQRQKHPAAAVDALLGRADRQHPVRRRGHPAGEHRRPARTGKPCDAGDRAVCGYHRQQHPHRKARCCAGRSGGRLQKGCAG